MGKYIDLAENYIHEFDYKNAFMNLEKAYEANEVGSYAKIGIFYIDGLGVEKDVEKGLFYIEEGARNNDSESLSYQGDFYYQGKYYKMNLDKAFECFNKALNLGDIHAIGMVGLCYYAKGNYDEAIKYFKKGAGYNDVNSIFFLGESAYYGRGMNKDYKLSFYSYDACVKYMPEKDEFKMALADLYYNGYGIDIDYEKAFNLYLSIKEKNDLINYRLAFMLRYGLGVEIDYIKAYELFKNIKTKEAQFELGLMDYFGYGVEENKKEAYFKFFASASFNHILSYPFVGDCYLYGYGVKKDYNEALKWYNKALDEQLPNQYINIAYVYMKQKKYDIAIDNLLKENDSLLKAKALGEAYLKNKEYDKAIEIYNKALEYKDPLISYKLYEIYKKGLGVKKNKELSSKYYLEYLALQNKE